jgi:hypothetical protein
MLSRPSTAATVVGVGFSSYFLFGNLFAKYGGTLPLSEHTSMRLATDQKLKSWRWNFEVGKVCIHYLLASYSHFVQQSHLGGSTALAATSYLVALLSAPTGSISGPPLLAATLASIGVAAFTLIAMTPTNKRLLQLNQDADAGVLKATNADVQGLVTRWKRLHNFRMIIGSVAYAAGMAALLLSF